MTVATWSKFVTSANSKKKPRRLRRSISVMEICEVFEEWEGSEIEAIATVESLLLGEGDDEEESAPPQLGDDEADGSDDEDEDESSFKCRKCKKVYHTGWLKRHELSCSGAKGKAKKKTQVLSDHQTKTRRSLQTWDLRNIKIVNVYQLL